MARGPKRVYAGETMERMWAMLNDSDSIAEFSRKFDRWRKDASWRELVDGYAAVQMLSETEIDGPRDGKVYVILGSDMTKEQWLAKYAPKELERPAIDVVAEPPSSDRGDA